MDSGGSRGLLKAVGASGSYRKQWERVGASGSRMREREEETDLRKILGGGYWYYREPQPLNFYNTTSISSPHAAVGPRARTTPIHWKPRSDCNHLQITGLHRASCISMIRAPLHSYSRARSVVVTGPSPVSVIRKIATWLQMCNRVHVLSPERKHTH